VLVEGLEPGQTYRFKVRAVTACGESSFSEEEVFTVSLTPTAPEVSVKYDAGTDCQMSITWERSQV
jgi:hypothetical protein